jgi:hypothetical protein
MKGKYKKIKVMLIAFALVVFNIVGSVPNVYAAEAYAIILADKMEDAELALKPGETKQVRVPLKALGGPMSGAMVSVSAGSAPFTFSQPKLTTKDETSVTYLSDYGITYVDFNINVKETAKVGNWPVTIKVSSPSESTMINLTLDPINFYIQSELSPAQISMSEVKVNNAIIGGVTEVEFALKNEGQITAKNTYYSINYGTTGIAPNYGTQKIKLDDMAPGQVKYVRLPIEILSNAEAGLKTLTATIEYKDSDGKDGTDTHQIYVDVRKDDNAPELMIDSVTYDSALKPGAEVTVKAILRNYGSQKAENVTVKIDDTTIGADGFYKNYFTDTIYTGGVKADAKIEAKIPLKVSTQATGGNKKLNLILAYEDKNGNKYTSTISIYPEIVGGASSSGLILTNVKQTPDQPIAGDNMQVSFELKNESGADITDVKISLPGLDGSTFIPTNSEPYILVEKIAAGKSKKVSIPLKVSANIPEGLNNLSVKYSYSGSTATDPVVIPIRNIQNDLGSNSKPKLIISKYVADAEELRAGSTFNFTFDIYNTHSSISAKNITVTLTQADNIFSVTQGSNSFFISKIEPGDSVQQTVELKVKSDATTKAYPLKVSIEYEYEGIKPNPETGEVGEKRTEELNLQAVENSRPVVDYVNVYSWDGNVVSGSTATLSFEFYNMGKSPLNNVIATVEGDFTKADGNMYFLGNVAAGSSALAEFDVIPNVEGTANGLLRVSFEDSNGEKIEFTKDFQTEVMPATVFDPGMENGGAGEVFNPEMPIAKAAILPVWLFVILQLVIIAVFIPVTRKVVISVYKAKLRKKEQEEI